MFDWDEHNIGHIAGHDLHPQQVEFVLLGSETLFGPAYSVGLEQRWTAIGSDGSGRILFVVFILRGAGIRVVTARPANRKERLWAAQWAK